MRTHYAMLLILVCCTITGAQEPKKDPCAKEALKASMAEARIAAERTRAETAAARYKQVADDLIKQTIQVGESEARAATEQKRANALAAENSSAQEKIAVLKRQLAEKDRLLEEKERTISVLVADRDVAQHGQRRAKKRTLIALAVAAVFAVIGATR